MTRGSIELTNARKDEIINACVSLYETMSFRDITIKEISELTSLKRAAIYNYFQTKEEIFLALLQREYELWAKEINTITAECETMTPDEIAQELAHSLEKRQMMLKLFSMNHFDMEANSRLELLIDFKAAYGNSIRAVESCLEPVALDMLLMITDEEHIVYGSDFPHSPAKIVTDKKHHFENNEKYGSIIKKIYYGNAEKLLKILGGR